MDKEVLVSAKGKYLFYDTKAVSYIVILYNKYYPAYIAFECDENKQVLGKSIWDEENVNDCIKAIEITYSIRTEWRRISINNITDDEQLVAEAINRCS